MTMSLALLGLAACAQREGIDKLVVPDAGHVVMQRSTEWVEVLVAKPETSDDHRFGDLVAVAGDDVYVTSQSLATTAWRLLRYSRQRGEWSRSKVLLAEDFTSAGSLYVNDDEVWLGVPKAGQGGEVLRLSRDLNVIDRVPSPVADADAEFGTSVLATSEWLFVGAAGQESDSGAVHVFRRTESGLVAAGVLRPPTESGYSRLGHAMVQDELHLYVGAPDRCAAGRCGPGAVYVYSPDASGAWQQDTVWRSPEPGLNGFGHSLAVRGMGRVVVGAPFSERCEPNQGCLEDPGQAYMASGDVMNPTWSDPLRPEAPRRQLEYFARSVAADGPHVVIGAQGDGACAPNTAGGGCDFGTVFVMTDGEPYRRVRARIARGRDTMGRTVAISGNVLVISGPNAYYSSDVKKTTGRISIFELQPTMPF